MTARGRLAAGLLLLVQTACAHPGYGGRAQRPNDWLESTGFPARRAWPEALVHLDREDVPVRGGVTDVIRELPRVSIRTPGRDDWGVWLTDPEDHPVCPLQIYLNGSVLEWTGAQSPTLDRALRVSELDGVELYEGHDGPARDPSGCGVLLLWSEARLRRGDRAFRGAVVGRLLGTAWQPTDQVRLVQRGDLPAAVDGGRFHLDDLRPGSYEIEVRREGRVLMTHSVRVYAHQTTEVELEIGYENASALGVTLPGGL